MSIHEARYIARPVFDALGPEFADAVEPATFPEHTLRWRNDRWAARVGLDTLTADEWIAHMARFEPLPDNLTKPLAMRYHGHQFRSYNPRLGDGRGFLYAQCVDAQDGRILDLGTKGSGQTPYSRSADGRLTLKGGVREILAAEMLEALGVTTSKVLSVVETGEALQRNDEPSPTRSCVMVRLGHSHIRFGTFQRHAYEKSDERLGALAEHVATHYLPQCQRATPGATAQALFAREVRLTATLCAQWMAAGFVHGVLNTDNMNITGESFDYGPWRFLPTLDPHFTAAYFDRAGLYRYGYQPAACRWNLERLADALGRIADRGQMQEQVEAFDDLFWHATCEAYLRRLGVASRDPARDGALVSALLEFMEETDIPYQAPFFDWYGGMASRERAEASARWEPYYTREGWGNVMTSLKEYEAREEVDLDHAYFATREEPCDMLIDEMEALWAPIDAEDDWGPLYDKIAEIRQMGEALTLLREDKPDSHT